MTHPGKNPGMPERFPTPNEVSPDTAYLVFYFPDTDAFPQLILGALKPLTFSYNYYQWGDLTPDETSLLFDQIVGEAPYNLLPKDVPAPYWDDAEDNDDQQPSNDQEWYGEVTGEDLTWQENASIWLITGFLAATGQVGAAIAFKTIAPRFALAFRTGDVGGIIRVVIDASDAGTVDTYSATTGEIERTFVGDPDLEEHDILLILEAEHA